MTQITHIRTAPMSFRSGFDRLTRLPAIFRAVSSLLQNLRQAFAGVQRSMLASRQQEEALRRLDQLDEHQLRDVGLVRVEEVIGWRIAVRGAAPVAIVRYSYRPLADAESRDATERGEASNGPSLSK